MSKIENMNAIVLNGEVHELVDPKFESCGQCSLDAFCDNFKDALCDVFAGGRKGMIFKKSFTIKAIERADNG